MDDGRAGEDLEGAMANESDIDWRLASDAMQETHRLEHIPPTAEMHVLLEWFASADRDHAIPPARSRLRMETCPPRFLDRLGLLRVERTNAEMRFQVRIAGERVRDAFPLTGPGTWLNDHPRMIDIPVGMRAALETFERVAREARPLAVQAEWIYQNRLFRYRRLTCPLSEDGRTVDHLLNFFELDFTRDDWAPPVAPQPMR
jgi:hypothetical protein